MIPGPIGLGLAALGRPAYITLGREQDLGDNRSLAAMEIRCHEMLDAAYASGIRYVDAARSYGHAEAFLASWLQARGLAPGAVTVGSKWGYAYTGGWTLDADVHERKDLSLATLERQYGETRAILGAHLALYQVHSATIESGVFADRGVLGELARLRSEGLVIGLSVSGARQGEAIRRALDVRVDGDNPFQSVQATWNLLEPSAGPALAEAKARGWTVIVKEALANGRLTNRHAGLEVRPLVDRAKAAGATLDAVAIAAALSHPWVDVVLSGAATREQLASNLGALQIPRDLAWPDVAEPAERYWGRRSGFEWK